MNVTFLLFAFALAVITGAIAITVLSRSRPDWPLRRRLLIAVLLLPGLTLVTAGAGAVAILSSSADDTMKDLAAAAIAKTGAVSALVALAGGMIGALLRLRGPQR